MQKGLEQQKLWKMCKVGETMNKIVMIIALALLTTNIVFSMSEDGHYKALQDVLLSKILYINLADRLKTVSPKVRTDFYNSLADPNYEITDQKTQQELERLELVEKDAKKVDAATRNVFRTYQSKIDPENPVIVLVNTLANAS